MVAKAYRVHHAIDTAVPPVLLAAGLLSPDPALWYSSFGILWAILLALDEPTRAALDDLFRERRIEKTYWALVRGRPPAREGEIKFPLLEERGRSRVSARAASSGSLPTVPMRQRPSGSTAIGSTS